MVPFPLILLRNLKRNERATELDKHCFEKSPPMLFQMMNESDWLRVVSLILIVKYLNLEVLIASTRC